MAEELHYLKTIQSVGIETGITLPTYIQARPAKLDEGQKKVEQRR